MPRRSEGGTERLRYFFCRDHFSLDDNGLLDLLAGVSDATTDAAHLLDRLAAEAHDKPDVLAALDTSDPWSVVALRDHLTPYVEAHGHTALDQSDYAAPTLIEQPTRIVQLFREARERHARGQRVTPDSGAREELVRTLRAQLGSDALRAEFDTLLGEAQAVYGVRDTDISLVFQAMGLLRYALLEAGRRLAAARVLVSPSDVWFLRRDELEDALAGTVPADLSAKATERRAEHERRSTVRPPSRFGTPPEGFPPRPSGLAPEAQRALEASAWSEGLGRRQRGAGSDVADELRG